MELYELHIDEFGTSIVCERVSVARVFPAVARDLECLPDAARGQHDRLGVKHLEVPLLAVVCQRTHHAFPVLEECDHGTLHVDVHSLVDTVVLQGPDHLQSGAVSHVRKPRVCVPAEIALQNSAVVGAVEQGSPRLQLAHRVRRLFGV